MVDYEFGSENVSIRNFKVSLLEGDNEITSAQAGGLSSAGFDSGEGDILEDALEELKDGTSFTEATIVDAIAAWRGLFTKIGDLISDSFDGKIEESAAVDLVEGGKAVTALSGGITVNSAEFTANNVEFFEDLDGKKIVVLVESTRLVPSKTGATLKVPDIVFLYKPVTYNYQENLSGGDTTLLPFAIQHNNKAKVSEIRTSGKYTCS